VLKLENAKRIDNKVNSIQNQATETQLYDRLQTSALDYYE